MRNNADLQKARTLKKDEFYTTCETIEKELPYYKDQFKDKAVYCNCDNENSSFVQFFRAVKTDWGISSLSYSGFTDGEGTDFRSVRAIERLRESDIIVTNPPFSLFREFIDLMMREDKKFLILGNLNAISCKSIFPHFKKGLLRLGYSIHSGAIRFNVPYDYPLSAPGCGVDPHGIHYIRVKGVRWFTNLRLGDEGVSLFESCNYKGNRYYGNEALYPKYDNYDAINVDRTSDIPLDYYGVMGVPITFMDKYNSNEFEIIGHEHDINGDGGPGLKEGQFEVNGVGRYARILIRRKR